MLVLQLTQRIEILLQESFYQILKIITPKLTLRKSVLRESVVYTTKKCISHRILTDFLKILWTLYNFTKN